MSGWGDQQAKVHTQRPTPTEFIEFRTCGIGAVDQPVYKWLHGESGFRRAEKKFSRSRHCQSLVRGKQLEVGSGVNIVVEADMQEQALSALTAKAKLSQDKQVAREVVPAVSMIVSMARP